METDPMHFRLEEYKQLKGEVAGLLARIETLSRFALVVAATVFAWLATQGVGTGVSQPWCSKLPSKLFANAWFIPFAFTALAGFAAFAAYWRGRQIAKYLSMLESKFLPTGEGWEHYLEPKFPVLTVTGSAFWLVLLLATYYAGDSASRFVSALTEVCAAAAK